MKNYKYLIIGGGTTAGYAAAEFVEQNIKQGELCIISAEKILPMNRPPLSKDYLKDESNDDELLINDKQFYLNHDIEVMLETTAKEVKFAEKKVVVDSGEEIGYEKLLIATGSSVIHPGLENENLENIFYLRNVVHSDKIRVAAEEAKNVVIIGGGYIGTETAAILKEMGLQVSMIIPEDKLLAKFATPEIGEFFRNLFREKGVDLYFKEEANGFEGREKVEMVKMGSGRDLPADLVVVGAGVRPNVTLFEDTHLNINQGIVVDEYCQTNIPDVFAAGDVVEFPDVVFDKIRHVDHWENAFEQGKHAARVMTGKFERYNFLPFFFSDVFEYSYEFFGDSS
ncbi:MAG: NAD(P)/FAD-dependent oxidoreductase, partial [Bacteroidota bacterium]